MTISYEILEDRIAGALYGVAVGDALGAPLEFMSAEQISKMHGKVTGMIGGGWLRLRPGDTTDDTAMTLAVAEGIIENPDTPIAAIGKRFISWANSGPIDIGGTCSASIKRAQTIADLFDMEQPDVDCWMMAASRVAEENGQRSGGNGALMRTIYPALFYPSRLKAEEIAVLQGEMTHRDDDSAEACKLYARVVHYLINTPDLRSAIAFSGLLTGTKYNPRTVSVAVKSGEVRPTGYVVDSFKSAIYAFWTNSSFGDALIAAVNLGGDADTIGAICGGLAGAYYGYHNIPKEWVDALPKGARANLDAAIKAAAKNQWAAQER